MQTSEYNHTVANDCELTNKSSAVAEMGDRSHNRHGPQRGGAAVPLSWRAGKNNRLIQCGGGAVPL